jgi:hypothetical protein
LIETLYWEARKRGGQQAQLDFEVATDDLATAFEASVNDLQSLKARGPFFPEGKRKPLFALSQARAGSRQIVDTEHVQALLGRPPRWEVAGDRSPDFEYVARELTPMSSVARGERVWLTSRPDRRVSLDALLVNADDRTPIVAEIKVGGDENAELALIQALAAAAQLSSGSQLTRLYRQFYDFFDEAKPAKVLDVYVVTARAPERGVRPQLASRAHARAEQLMAHGALSRWIRRIAFIEMTLVDGRPAFENARRSGGIG